MTSTKQAWLEFISAFQNGFNNRDVKLQAGAITSYLLNLYATRQGIAIITNDILPLFPEVKEEILNTKC